MARRGPSIPRGVHQDNPEHVGYFQDKENRLGTLEDSVEAIQNDTGTSTSLASLDTRVTALETGATVFTSTDQTITPGGPLTLAHGLSAAPNWWRASIVCQSTDGGWAAGDVVAVSPQMHILVPVGAATVYAVGAQISVDATNVNVIFANGFTGGSNQVFQLGNKTSGSTFTADNTKWLYRVVAGL